MSDRVAVIVAHPDDEVLGCGGTIAKHAAAGASVDIAILCLPFVGAMVRAGGGESASRTQAGRAASVVGANTVHPYGYRDQRLDLVGQAELSEKIGGFISGGSYDVVYTHHPGDLNADHRAVADAVLVATRPVADRAFPRAVYACEVASSTEWSFGAARPFRPTRYEALTPEHLRAKVAALACYAAETREPPHPRSGWVAQVKVEQRGSEAGVRYAEAFEVLREVSR